MAARRLTVDVDDETVRRLGELGEPAEVLVRLASVATGVSEPVREPREQTDESLRAERREVDAGIKKWRETEQALADERVRLARERFDQAAEAAGSGEQASDLLARGRTSDDSAVKGARADQRRRDTGRMDTERESTDSHLSGERVQSDVALVDLREANERMVSATIRAQEAQALAEERERELRVVAEFRERFIGILGHDLRNPLGAIAMSASVLLRRGRLDGSDQRMANRIISTSQRMARLIAQLLDLTRVRLGGGLPLNVAPADLGELCQQAVDEFEAPITLKTEGDLTGTWDADRLTEAVVNLAGNAVEYAAPGTPVLIVARGDAARVVVEISNHGEPIADEVLPFIFEPFRRVKQGEKSPAGHLGLGLYIAKQIMLAHGGTLEGRSAGGTTTFVMRWPRAVPVAEVRASRPT